MQALSSHNHAAVPPSQKVRVQLPHTSTTNNADDPPEMQEVTSLHATSFIDLIISLPVEVVEHYFWPQLAGRDKQAFARTNKAAWQYAAQHFIRRIRVHINPRVLMSGALPDLFDPPDSSTFKPTALDINCTLMLGDGWAVQEHLQSLLPALGQHYPHVQELNIDFGKIWKYGPVTVLTPSLLHSAVISYTSLTSLSITNFSTTTEKGKHNLALAWFNDDTMQRLEAEKTAICDLTPLQLTPHLTSLSFNPSPDNRGPGTVTWRSLCTLPKLDKLQSLEVREVALRDRFSGDQETFPTFFPALRHLAFYPSSGDSWSWSLHNMILAILKQHTSLHSLNMGPSSYQMSGALCDWLANHMHSLQRISNPAMRTDDQKLRSTLLALPSLEEIRLGTVDSWVEDTDRFATCRTLCITESALLPPQIMTLMNTCPALEHLEVRLGLPSQGWGHPEDAVARKQAWAQCGTMVNRLLNSHLKYLSINVKYKHELKKLAPFVQQLQQAPHLTFVLLEDGSETSPEDAKSS